MGTMTPILRLRAWWQELTADNDTRGPRECAYGNDPAAEGRCYIIVPPGQGLMSGHSVYCSADHVDMAVSQRSI